MKQPEEMTPEELAAAEREIEDRCVALANGALEPHLGGDKAVDRAAAEAASDLLLAMSMVCLRANVDPRQFVTMCVIGGTLPRKGDPITPRFVARIAPGVVVPPVDAPDVPAPEVRS